MVAVLWFWHQLILTWQQVRVDVTIPHVFTGITLYVIVHGAVKTGQRAAARAEARLVAATHHEVKRPAKFYHREFDCAEPAMPCVIIADLAGEL